MFSKMSLKIPISQIFASKNSSLEYPSNSIRNGFTSSICPLSASRISIPSFADSKRRR
jgi:hypothetical protein